MFPGKSRGGTLLPYFWVGANGEVLENKDEKKQAYDVMNTVKFMYLNCGFLEVLLATASAALIPARIVYTEVEKARLLEQRKGK